MHRIDQWERDRVQLAYSGISAAEYYDARRKFLAPWYKRMFYWLRDKFHA
jgi:hypothetical protein